MGIETYTGVPTLLGVARDIGAAGAMLGIANVWPDVAGRAFQGDETALGELVSQHTTSLHEFPRALKAMTAARWDVPAHVWGS